MIPYGSSLKRRDKLATVNFVFGKARCPKSSGATSRTSNTAKGEIYSKIVAQA